MSEISNGAGISATIRALVERLELGPHPEGGWYRETWRSKVVLREDALPAGYSGDRNAMTSILFLLPTGSRSRLHRVRSEELWIHQQGDDLRLGIGQTQAAAVELQAVVPPGHWQESEALPGSFGYALVGCVVAPGFEFADFEMRGSIRDDSERQS